MIRLENICKSYGNDTNSLTVLNHVNLDIESGKFAVIMGQSGSGKSTLLNILGCLDNPDSGRYLLEDIDISKLAVNKKSWLRSVKMGFIFQAFHLIPELTVFENVQLPLIYRGIPKSERTELSRRILETVGLESKLKNYPFQLSGGEQQGVAISRALVGDPVVLFADEPTGNLDTKNAEEIMMLLCRLNQTRGTTVVMVTHNPEHIQFATQLIRINDGIIS